MKTCVLGDFIVGHPDAWDLEISIWFTCLIPFEAEIFEIVDPLSVYELYELAGGSSVRIAQVALQSYVVVLDGSARKSVLKERKDKNNRANYSFVEALKIE